MTRQVIMEAIEPKYLLLAYAGMVIFTLMKIEEDRKRGLLESWKLFRGWIKSNVISIIISIITVPLLLYICSDPLIGTYFPVSIPTSVLIGFQTQGLFRSLMTMVGPKKDGQPIPLQDDITNNDNNNNPVDNNNDDPGQ